MTSADFTAAQRRVVARRKEREVAALTRPAEHQQTRASNLVVHLPQPAQRLWSAAASQWSILSGTDGTRPAYRVGQVDAELLDEELLELLRGQVGEALKYYGSHLRDNYAAEIVFALRTILFKITVWDKNASYGASLQNLNYIDARDRSPVPRAPKKWQKALYGLVSVGGRYAWTKWEGYLLDVEAGHEEPSQRTQVLSRLSNLLSNVHSMAAFASFLFFLVNGRYRTLLDRVFRLRLAPTTNQVRTDISFEYLNRQLVWHAFTEFLLFLLPLIGIHRWRRWLARAWRKMQSLFHRGKHSSEEHITLGGEFGFLPERTCAICYQDQNLPNPSGPDVSSLSGTSGGIVGSAQTDITNPYEAITCGCIYCYVCIAQRLEAEDDEGWTCLRCGETVHSCKPWSGDVLEELRSRSSSGKSVTFADDDDVGTTAVFKELDPMPMEDEKLEELEAELEQDAEQHVPRLFAGTDEWRTVLDGRTDAYQASDELDRTVEDDDEAYDAPLPTSRNMNEDLDNP